MTARAELVQCEKAGECDVKGCLCHEPHEWNEKQCVFQRCPARNLDASACTVVEEEAGE